MFYCVMLIDELHQRKIIVGYLGAERTADRKSGAERTADHKSGAERNADR
jgi:hypothetical protein